jgi:hypothetical protein
LLDVVRGNVLAWLAALRYAVRSGTHNQTAFALGLLHDAATALHDGELVSAIRRKALVLYRADENAPLHFEPSGEDFLSPALAEADLMRRVMSRASFARWLGGFLPGIPARDVGWLSPGRVDDETDGKLVHLHGLNLSRAWCLEGIAAALDATDARVAVLRSAARRHRRAGLAATLATRDYAGDHWLPTFAVYLLTGARPAGAGLTGRTPLPSTGARSALSSRSAGTSSGRRTRASAR